MSNEIKSDFALDAYALECAQDIVANCEDREDATEQAHEYADQSEHVIYYYKAHSICYHCSTDQGEQFLEDIGGIPNPTYDSLACSIAYGELRARIESALNDIFESRGNV